MESKQRVEKIFGSIFLDMLFNPEHNDCLKQKTLLGNGWNPTTVLYRRQFFTPNHAARIWDLVAICQSSSSLRELNSPILYPNSKLYVYLKRFVWPMPTRMLVPRICAQH